MEIFPVSPLPANTSRTVNWNENVVFYDSGEAQTDSPFLRPLYKWSIPIPVMTELKQQGIFQFQNAMKGKTRSFLMKDAYEFRVDSVMAVRSGITHAATLFFYDTNSYMVRPDSITVGSLHSSLSGYVRLGVEYSLDQDTGIVTVNTKNIADVWGVRSMQYYRKCKFVSQYDEKSILWNIFGTVLEVVELP